MELLHVATEDAWTEARRSGTYAPPALAQDGFLHLCTPAQLAFVLNLFFAGRTGLVLLHLDPGQLGDVRWERSEPGRDPFPHLYGSLPAAAVLRAEPLDP